jgi:flagellar motility protein MotE (MotC chaperone)
MSPPSGADDRVSEMMRRLEAKGIDPVDALLNLNEALADSIMRMSDEEVREMYLEMGVDPDEVAEQTRKLVQDALRRHGHGKD